MFKRISGWGRYPQGKAFLYRPEHPEQSLAQVQLARGQGRSYGDAAILTDGYILETKYWQKLISFDAQSGILEAEAGITVGEIVSHFAPQGWLLAVTPGTRFCTLGGAVAADVHGKNHLLAGSIGKHLKSLDIEVASGDCLHCSPTSHAELFWATVAGMGLTGIIRRIRLQLQPLASPFFAVHQQATQTLDETIEQLLQARAPYRVAWLDTLSKRHLGRGIVQSARIVPAQHQPEVLPQRRFKLPIDLPTWLINRHSALAFNRLYYQIQKRKTSYLASLEQFFYPLDAISDWNRAYGHRGFLQYQFLLPIDHASSGIAYILKALNQARLTTFLPVLKHHGEQGKGLLSFPKPGLSLALDIPYSPAVPAILRRLDAYLVERGGRLYLAKDACLSAQHFRQMYSRHEEFLAVKRNYDPHNRWKSDLSLRLKLDAR